MYDEAKAEAATEVERDRTPLQQETSRLHESITTLGHLAEKLGATLQPVLRSMPPTPDDGSTAIKAVDDRSEHVRDIGHAARRVEEVAQSVRSLLERLEV